MRFYSSTTAQTLAALILASQAYAQSITLTQFQQISGFTDACTQAYNTPLEGCTKTDFTNGNPCSQACAAGLQKETKLLNSACAGISAMPSTLIGMFFNQQGVQVLCPKIAPPGSTSTPAAPTTSTTQTSAAPVMTSASQALSSTSANSEPSTSSPSSTDNTDSTTQSSSSSTGTTTVQTSFDIIMTKPSTATATPAGNFGGDIGNLNGPSGKNSASVSTRLSSVTVVMAVLAVGILM